MAIRFPGSADPRSANTDLLPGINGTQILTMSFWLLWDTFANDDALAFEYTTDALNYFQTFGFIINPNDSTTGGFLMGAGVSLGASYSSFTRPSAGVWHHYVICWDRLNPNAVSAAYVDGIAQSITNGNTEVTVQSTNFGNEGGNLYLYLLNRRNISLWGAGKLAELAIYPSTTLSAEEAIALYMGVCPLDLRQDVVPYYYPLDGDDAIIRRQIGNQATGPVDNLSAIILDEHPPIPVEFEDWNSSIVFVSDQGGGGGTAHEVAFNSVLNERLNTHSVKASLTRLDLYKEEIDTQVNSIVSNFGQFNQIVRTYLYTDVAIEGPSGSPPVYTNISNYCVSGIYEHIFRQGTLSKPNLWLTLSSGIPVKTGGISALRELSHIDGYARINVTGNDIWSTPTEINGQCRVYNSQEITFGPAGGNWGWVSGWALLDNSGEGAGNILFIGDTLSKYVFTNDSIVFSTGTLYITMGG